MDLITAYLFAHGAVLKAGFANDIDWAESLKNVKTDPQYVLREGAWVIVNSGFRNAVARKLWPSLLDAFHEFDPERVTRRCLPAALKVLRHKGKMEAIVELAGIIRDRGIGLILSDARSDPTSLTRLPFIGKVTCWHFAKILGADVVKPDVHLVRAAEAAGFETPLRLCTAIKAKTGDRLTVVDSILWRYGEQQKKQGWPGWKELFA